jgi:hypothetical protein
MAAFFAVCINEMKRLKYRNKCSIIYFVKPANIKQRRVIMKNKVKESKSEFKYIPCECCQFPIAIPADASAAILHSLPTMRRSVLHVINN